MIIKIINDENFIDISCFLDTGAKSSRRIYQMSSMSKLLARIGYSADIKVPFNLSTFSFNISSETNWKKRVENYQASIVDSRSLPNPSSTSVLRSRGLLSNNSVCFIMPK